MTRPQVLKRFVTVAVLASLCSALVISTNTRARAANTNVSTSSKISPDLRLLILSGNGDTRVKVIVQAKPSSSPSLLGGLLDAVGGLLVVIAGFGWGYEPADDPDAHHGPEGHDGHGADNDGAAAELDEPSGGDGDTGEAAPEPAGVGAAPSSGETASASDEKASSDD